VKITRRQALKTAAVGAAGAALPFALTRPSSRAAVSGSVLPLPRLPKARPVGKNSYSLTARPGLMQVHPDFAKTTVWGYDDASGRGVASPGYVVEVQKGTPTTVRYGNALPGRHLFDNVVPDPMHAPAPVRTNAHLHGGFVAGASDGNPYADPREYKPDEVQTVTYPNAQAATMLWYHDHADQITRLNVYAGLAGVYLIRDASDTGAEPNRLGVPGGAYEVPLVLADRLFDGAGGLFYSPDSTWLPEFFGDTPVVNGAVRPYLDVEPRKYRFRLLNASNARFYNLNLAGGPQFFQIGSDGGLFDKPVAISNLILLPAERADVIVDFSRYAGQTLTLANADLPVEVSSPAPPLSSVMEFRVGRRVTTPGPATIPSVLPGTMPALGKPALTRDITLEEVEDPVTGEPAFGSLNGRKFDDARGVQERVKAGSIEDWRIVNLTDDTHPIHLHLVQFQIIDRTPFDRDGYQAALSAARAANPDAPNLDPTPFVMGRPASPDANERGWKDTVRSNPGQITRIRMRWTLPTGVSAPQRYVYHCHILEHEDNSMMRPLEVVA
jgi:spore coat protein A, manganese oxidase